VELVQWAYASRDHILDKRRPQNQNKAIRDVTFHRVDPPSLVLGVVETNVTLPPGGTPVRDKEVLIASATHFIWTAVFQNSRAVLGNQSASKEVKWEVGHHVVEVFSCPEEITVLIEKFNPLDPLD
jgi:hypothetical protein